MSMSPASQPHPHAPWIVILAGVSAALHVGKLPPAIPALQADLGVTLVQAGFLLSLVQLASMALGIVAGLLAEGIGLRRGMLAGLGLLTLAGTAGGWAHGAATLLALRAVEGVGVLLVTVPAPSLVRRTVAPGQMTRMLGFWGAFMPFGTAVALLLGPLVIGAGRWPAWWWLTAAATALMALWVRAAVPPDAPPDAPAQPPAQRPVMASRPDQRGADKEVDFGLVVENGVPAVEGGGRVGGQRVGAQAMDARSGARAAISGPAFGSSRRCGRAVRISLSPR